MYSFNLSKIFNEYIVCAYYLGGKNILDIDSASYLRRKNQFDIDSALETPRIW